MARYLNHNVQIVAYAHQLRTSSVYGILFTLEQQINNLQCVQFLFMDIFVFFFLLLCLLCLFIIIVGQMKEAARKQWSIVYSFNLTHDWLILLIIPTNHFKIECD